MLNQAPETRRGVDKRGRHVLQITSQLCRVMFGGSATCFFAWTGKGVCDFTSTYHDLCHYLHFIKITNGRPHTRWETTDSSIGHLGLQGKLVYHNQRFQPHFFPLTCLIQKQGRGQQELLVVVQEKKGLPLQSLSEKGVE